MFCTIQWQHKKILKSYLEQPIWFGHRLNLTQNNFWCFPATRFALQQRSFIYFQWRVIFIIPWWIALEKRLDISMTIDLLIQVLRATVLFNQHNCLWLEMVQHKSTIRSLSWTKLIKRCVTYFLGMKNTDHKRGVHDQMPGFLFDCHDRSCRIK